MEAILFLLAVAGVAMLVVYVMNYYGEKSMGEEGWKEFSKAVREEEISKKYNYYRFSCPMCKSKKVKRISGMDRAISVGTLGIASSKMGKQYECDHCKHKW